MISTATYSAFERIRSGESTAQQWELDWETVYSAMWPILIAHASKRGLALFAADAVQSALLSILAKPSLVSSFATIEDFLAYAYRAVTNKAIDTIRILSRLEPLDAKRDPVDSRGEHLDPLFFYVPNHLSKDELDLLRLFYVEGKTYREIAEECATTEREIRTRMFRLQDRLAQLRKGPTRPTQ